MTEKKIMEYKVKDILEYTIAFVSEFATKFGMTDAQAFRYVNQFHGIDILEKHYDVMHTLSFENVIETIQNYCRRQGGSL